MGPARNTGVSRFVPRRAVSPGTTRISATSIANTLQVGSGKGATETYVSVAPIQRPSRICCKAICCTQFREAA